jgi:hypothetical protein
MVLRQKGIFQATLLAQNKAATEFRGGNFFVRANDLFRLCKGIWMESFGRISLFPGLPLASSRFFRMFWIQNCFSVSDGGFLLWFFGYRITGFSLDIKIYWLVFTGCRTNVLQDLGFQLDCQGLDFQVLRIFWIYGA